MTTTTPKPVSGMVAVSARNKKIKPLGYVVWYSVPDRSVPLRALKRAWFKGGLEGACLPNDPRALYLFKRAVRGQQGRVKHDDGSMTETDVVDVLDGAQHCIYQISRVVRDADRREVDYPKALRVIFDKEAQEIKFNRLGDTKLSEVKPMMDEIMDFFEQNTKIVNGHKVRTLVRKYLREDTDEAGGVFGLSGENLRGKAGGVYFVAARHKDRLDGLAECLQELYGEDGSTYGLYSVPLADGRSEREMIRAHHVANTVKEAQEAIDDVAKLLRQDRVNRVRSDVASHWFRKLQALRRRSAEYDSMLKEEQGDVASIIEMMSKQIGKLPVA